MLDNINNTFNNKNLNAFVTTVTETISVGIKKYWEQDVDLKLLALNDFKELRDEKLVSRVDFFTSLIKTDKHKPVTIRLSKDCIRGFFDTVLELNPNFKLAELTPLEVRILNNFSEFLYKRLNEHLIPTKGLKISEASEKEISLVFLAQIKDLDPFKFMISIPSDRIKLDDLKKKPAFVDEDFITSKTTVRIRAGSTKVALEDLENLSETDIVLLEDSNISKLILISGKFQQSFNVKADPSLVLNVKGDDGDGGNDNNFDIDNEEVTMEKNLWDDIQIEVNAEFEKVKMTIGELKQITQGQVVDLGSVFNNEISLFVENKKVAIGELIIINDRYAVRLNEVLGKVIPPPPPPAPAKPQGAPAAGAQPRPQGPNPAAAQARPQGAAPRPRPQGAPPPPPPRRPQVPPGAPQARPQPQPRPQGAPPPPPPGAAQPRPQGQEVEDFDYSDFEK